MHRAARTPPFVRAGLALLLSGIALACRPAGAPSPTPAAGTGDAAGALPASPRPALWRASDADTTIWLFGTVHVLPPGLDWRSPAVSQAFGAAGAVYFETSLEPDILELQRLIALLGYFVPPDRLSDYLAPEDARRVAALAERLDVAAPIDQMRPWFAALTLSEAFVTSAGYDPASGVERRLGPEAKAAGKDLRTFETIEQQLRFFADLPHEVQIDYLVEGVKQIEEEPELLDELVASWAAGDVAALETLVVEDEREQSPVVYDAILKNRNRAWAEELARVAAGEPGVFFVAVGAAHLAGPDSLATLLARPGLSVERVQ